MMVMSRVVAHAHPSHWANSFGMHAPFFSILAKFSKPDFALWARIEKMGHAYRMNPTRRTSSDGKIENGACIPNENGMMVMSREVAHAHPSHWANSFGMHAPFSKYDFALWARIEKWGMHTE